MNNYFMVVFRGNQSRRAGSTSKRSRIRVELLGLYPTVFTTMCKVACNPTGIAGLSTSMQQLQEYPPQTRQDMEIAAGIFDSLSQHPDVEVTAVNVTSPRGIWLAMRHRLHAGLWAIVEGTVIDARTNRDAIQDAVKKVRVRQMASLAEAVAPLST